MLRLLTTLALVMSCVLARAARNDGASYLIPQIAVGEHFSTVFSISGAVNAEGCDPLVRRNGGTKDQMRIRRTE